MMQHFIIIPYMENNSFPNIHMFSFDIFPFILFYFFSQRDIFGCFKMILVTFLVTVSIMLKEGIVRFSEERTKLCVFVGLYVPLRI